MAPIIPGLNDSEIPAVLAASKDAGAMGAGYVMLRLPLTVGPVFWEWLERTHPGRFQRIQKRIKEVRGGKFNDSEFGTRMSGTGKISRGIADLFSLFRKRHGLDGPLTPLDCSRFRSLRLSQANFTYSDYGSRRFTHRIYRSLCFGR